VYNKEDQNIETVFAKGCWTDVQGFSLKENNPDCAWSVRQQSAKNFHVLFDGDIRGEVRWQHIGQHNVQNALAAIAAAYHVGIDIEHACNALTSFQGVKRRLETLFSSKNVTLIDDFAHHPTAIEKTLDGIRAQYPEDKIIAVFDPHSNTMKQGEHSMVLAEAFKTADSIWAYQHPELDWSITDIFTSLKDKTTTFTNVASAASEILSTLESEQHSHIVVLSNGSFSGMRQFFLDKISSSKL